MRLSKGVGWGWGSCAAATSAESQGHHVAQGMIEFVFPHSRALLPTFLTNCTDESHFAQMESHLARIPTSTPFLYSTVTYPFQGYVRTQK